MTEFKVGQKVRCISDEQPEYYTDNWTKLAGIKKGDIVTVKKADDANSFRVGPGYDLRFEEDKYYFNHCSDLFEPVLSDLFKPEETVDFQLDGILSVPVSESMDDVLAALQTWVESRGYTFGGSIEPSEEE